jgi:DNA-directed RNA polymerase specialized sigma24 family protein
MQRTGKAERDASFTAFVEQATPSLLRTAWLLTGEHHVAHDLVQAALVRTYVAWPRVRPETALAYARRVLVNDRTDRWRRHGAELAVASLPETGASPGGATEDRDLVVRLLATLPEQQRRVVVLR